MFSGCGLCSVMWFMFSECGLCSVDVDYVQWMWIMCG